MWVVVAVLPAPSLALAVNVYEPGVEVSIGENVARSPSQVAKPDPPESVHE
ncbi:MAG: hypothetical protein ACKV2O_25295 [Acidimicrobiales bacterium]